MRYTIFDTPILNTVLHWLSVAVLKISGWQKEGQVPATSKYVVIAAPHTSNWDLPLGLLFAFAFRVKVHWMGKDSMFRRPFGGFFKWLGGIPVDRSKSTGMVAQTVQAFCESENLVLIIAPEGTRTKPSRWRSGFYHIAQGAGVPVVLGFLDYDRKAGGAGPAVVPTGNIEADMKTMRTFYAGVTPKHPDRMSSAIAGASA
ncbi:MAG: glycerol acyltransferase [Candidatus Abyssobacteria bacterium SURF_17]|uniref:Glycerol acyltransferase n=1 Tax=Candidatus Abyssobacteria bacterium SURF_17 TaxID=2093361 RepID=A0A419F3A1_9BACT|nr:MAG: glycerol acyltransferase [Candidatus Abyssubacteria bacterium SURF_17]